MGHSSWAHALLRHYAHHINVIIKHLFFCSKLSEYLIPYGDENCVCIRSNVFEFLKNIIYVFLRIFFVFVNMGPYGSPKRYSSYKSNFESFETFSELSYELSSQKYYFEILSFPFLTLLIYIFIFQMTMESFLWEIKLPVEKLMLNWQR